MTGDELHPADGPRAESVWKVMLAEDGGLLEPDRVVFRDSGWLTLIWMSGQYKYSEKRHVPPHRVIDVTELPVEEEIQDG